MHLTIILTLLNSINILLSILKSSDWSNSFQTPLHIIATSSAWLREAMPLISGLNGTSTPN